MVTAAGHVALAAGAPFTPSAILASFGSGMFRPCVFAAAAALLAGDDESPAAPGPHRFAAVSAFVVATYTATNLDNIFPADQKPFATGGWAERYAIAGTLAVLAALLARALRCCYPDPEAIARAHQHGRGRTLPRRAPAGALGAGARGHGGRRHPARRPDHCTRSGCRS